MEDERHSMAILHAGVSQGLRRSDAVTDAREC